MSPIEELFTKVLSPTICLCHWGSKSDLVVKCDAVLCLDSVNSIPFLVTWNKLLRCQSYELWMQMMCEGGVGGGFRSFIRSFVCLYKCAINCCLFIFYYIFVYFDFCFLHNFCRLTRMFFSQCAAGFLFYYVKKIQWQTMCVYVYLMAMHLYVFSVFCCAWISGGVCGSGRKSKIFLYDMRMKSIRSMLVCCSAAICCCYFCCYSFG